MTTRKMILVPERTMEELKQWRERSLNPLPHTPEVASTVRLGRELDTIVDRDDLTPEAKVAKFGSELHRYRTYLQQARHPEEQRTWKTETVPEAKPNMSTEDQDLMTAITSSVSTQLKPKVPLIFKHLKKHSDILTWEKDGQLQYKGQTIPGTNMVDLVTDALRPQPRKGYQPSGVDSFVQGLVESNIPRDWIRNPNYIKVMNQPRVQPKLVNTSKPKLVSTSRPKAMSTPKPLDNEDEEDDTGFYDATSVLPSTIIKDSTKTPISHKIAKDWQRMTPTAWSTIKKAHKSSGVAEWLKTQNLRKRPN